jgi:hypothetical protein
VVLFGGLAQVLVNRRYYWRVKVYDFVRLTLVAFGAFGTADGAAAPPISRVLSFAAFGAEGTGVFGALAAFGGAVGPFACV